MSSTVFLAILPLWVCIGIGYFLRTKVVQSVRFWKMLDRITYFVALPAMIISVMIAVPSTGSFFGGLGLTFLVANLVMFALLTLGFLIFRPLQQDAPGYSTVFQTATRWNVPAGLFIATAAFGEMANPVAAAILVASIPAINVANVLFLLWSLNESAVSKQRLITTVLSNPILLACVAGLVITGFDIQLGAEITDGLRFIGILAPPALLISIGAGMIGMRIGWPSFLTIMACVAKLAVLPLLVLAVGMVVAIPAQIMLIAVVFAAAPTAPNGYVLARQLGGDAGLYARILPIQTMIALLTVPLWVWIVGWVTG